MDEQPPRRRSGLLIPLIALAVLAIAGFGAWKWWDAQNASPEPQLTARATRKPLRPHPLAATAAPTGTVAPAGATTTSATMTSSTAPAGLTVKAPPVTTSIASQNTTTAATTNTTTAHPAATVAALTTTAPPPTSAAGIRIPPPAAGARTSTAPAAHPATAPTTRTSTAPAAHPSATPSSTTATSTAGTHIERAATGATITNTGAAPRPAAGDDALRAKYDAMAREQAANTAGAFTVQFELVCETASLTKALKSGSNQVWFSPLSYRGKACYRVFWGRFASHAEALQAVKDVPASLRGGATPVVIRIPRS